ncbi:MAG: peroxide stress protein YaaA [Corynebacterium sp.]|nr:peroxide stress protein YaaA [Corynebacterium sp.]
MLILLPPSETKATGGDNPPLDFAQLSFPTLTATRQTLATDLSRVPVADALNLLGISEKLAGEAQANTELFSQATLPAILRYTGVLYEALDAASLSAAERSHLAIGSALFGVVGANDLIPRYRLSAGNKIPTSDGELPTLKKRWGKSITNVLVALQEEGEFLLDLRSGGYQQLGPVPTAPTLRVESLQADGTRKLISHNNKLYKGRITRSLVQSGADPKDMGELAGAIEDLGYTVELPTDGAKKAYELTLVISSEQL